MNKKQTGLTLINQMLLIGTLGVILAVIVNYFWKNSDGYKHKIESQKKEAPKAKVMIQPPQSSHFRKA